MPIRRIYLDNNSTTPMLPEVLEAMTDYARKHWGNPASAHRTGAAVRRVLEDCRAKVATLLGAFPDEVIFTSGATEANNLAILGLGHLVEEVAFAAIEHPSSLEPAKRLVQQGTRQHTLQVDPLGYVDSLAVCTKATLIVLQLANHETGTVQRLAKLRQQYPAGYLHCDATQAVGKIPVHFHQIGASTLAASAHKFFGPPGIGVLLVNRCIRLEPQQSGGHQQQGVRPGTEPVMLAVGLAKALELACEQMQQRHERCRLLRELFLMTLQQQVNFVINGDAEHGLNHTLNLSFPGYASDVLFIRLDLAGIDCSTGSACSSGSMLPSPVLQAMGTSADRHKSAMRFSLNHLLSDEEVVDGAERIAREVRQLQTHSLS
jgi:cysteine desulfurase